MKHGDWSRVLGAARQINAGTTPRKQELVGRRKATPYVRVIRYPCTKLAFG